MVPGFGGERLYFTQSPAAKLQFVNRHFLVTYNDER